MPDVYNMYRGWFASTGTQGWDLAVDNASDQRISMSGFNGDGSMLGLWYITQCLGLSVTRSNAEFKMSLYLYFNIKLLVCILLVSLIIVFRINCFQIPYYFIGFDSTISGNYNFW